MKIILKKNNNENQSDNRRIRYQKLIRIIYNYIKYNIKNNNSINTRKKSIKQ